MENTTEDNQLNFVVAQLMALAMAFIFRLYLHPRLVSVSIRHSVSLATGLFLCTFCYGSAVFHVVMQTCACYILMMFAPRQYMHIGVFVLSMGYLLGIHTHRMLTDTGKDTLDILGPLMVTTQKVTALAFGLYDGTQKRTEDLNVNQRQHAIKKFPNLLEFFSYMFYFQTLLVGPMSFYNEYSSFIDGSNFRQYSKGKTKSEGYEEPSPKHAITHKLACCAVWILIIFVLLPSFPIQFNADIGFITHSSITYRIIYLFISSFCFRVKFYFVWHISEAICCASGLSFNGYDENGNARWDLINNVMIRELESATNLKEYVQSWNVQTVRWLRYICYDRATVQPVLMTNAVSAVWHGLFPGYYFLFIGLALFTMVGRKIHATVRPLFMSSGPLLKLTYDLITWIGTHLTIGILCVPFGVYNLSPSVTFYNSFYWLPHILSVLMFLVLPSRRGQSTPEKKAA